MPDAVSGDFQGVFDAAPVSLWIEDYSGIKSMFDGLRAAGVADIALHLQQHPDMVEGAIGANDVAARVGGDEFALLLRGSGEQAAEQMIRRLLDRTTLTDRTHERSRRGSTMFRRRNVKRHRLPLPCHAAVE